MTAMTRAGDDRPPTLFLHVGRGRTGTSSLQYWLWMNRPELARRGFGYPADPGVDPNAKARGVGNGSWLAPMLNAGREVDTGWPEAFREWLAAARAATPHVVVSSEFFWGAQPDHLERMRDVAASLGLATCVVGYIREQASHMISVYCQGVRKGRETAGLKDYLAGRAAVLGQGQAGVNAQYDVVLEKFERIFGAGNVHAGLFERNRLEGGDVRFDFAARLGLSAAGLDESARTANESPGVAEIELLRRINGRKDVVDIDGRRLFNVARARNLESSRDFEAQVPAAILARIREHYAASNERTRARHFPQLDGALFTVKPHGAAMPDADIESRSALLLAAALRSGGKRNGADPATIHRSLFDPAADAARPPSPRPHLRHSQSSRSRPAENVIPAASQASELNGGSMVTQVVQDLLSLYKDPEYLEVGVAGGTQFHAAPAARKVAVDPQFRFDPVEAKRSNPNATYHQVPSDVYFGEVMDPGDRFDVIFLDGLHTFEQTLRDFMNAIAVLKPKGVIVIDDIYPSSYPAALPDQREFRQLKTALGMESNSWMGDVYRLVFFINSFCQPFTYRAVSKPRQLVVWRAPRPASAIRDEKVETIGRLPYERAVLDKDVFQFRPMQNVIAEVRAAVLGEPFKRAAKAQAKATQELL